MAWLPGLSPGQCSPIVPLGDALGLRFLSQELRQRGAGGDEARLALRDLARERIPGGPAPPMDMEKACEMGRAGTTWLGSGRWGERRSSPRPLVTDELALGSNRSGEEFKLVDVRCGGGVSALDAGLELLAVAAFHLVVEQAVEELQEGKAVVDGLVAAKLQGLPHPGQAQLLEDGYQVVTGSQGASPAVELRNSADIGRMRASPSVRGQGGSAQEEARSPAP